MAVYDGEFKTYDDLPYGRDNPAESEIVYAAYDQRDYEGSAIIVYRRDGRWFENNDSHCSCNGLDRWEPEETTPKALIMRNDEKLRDAVIAAMTADYASQFVGATAIGPGPRRVEVGEGGI